MELFLLLLVELLELLLQKKEEVHIRDVRYEAGAAGTRVASSGGIILRSRLLRAPYLL